MRNTGTGEIQKEWPYHFFIVAVIACAGLFMIYPAAATPPSAMSLSFDGNSHELTVTITHATTDPRIHYIKDVKININGQITADFPYTSQPTKDTFTYTYPLQPKSGDSIEVTATCSLTGSATRALSIPPGTAATPATGQAAIPPVTQKAAMESLAIVGLFILISVRKT